MACRKISYDSKGAVHKRQRTNGKRIRAYLCPLCHRWHATTETVPTGKHRKSFNRPAF